MALSGIQIFKFLPGAKKTENANCKKCGCVTCMAYAMKLAKNDISIEKCPFIDEELKNTLLLENRKPQKKIEFGLHNKAIIGDETVIFRHDKTFINPCVYSINLNSDDANFDKKLEEICDYRIEQVGKEYKVDAIALYEGEKDFTKRATELLKLDYPIILIVKDYFSLSEIIDLVKEKKPLLYIKSQNIDELVLASKLSAIVVDGENPEQLSTTAEDLLKLGIQNIVLNLIQKVDSNIVEPLSMIRRSAIEKKFEPLGFPVMVSYNLHSNVALDTINLSALVCKYANLIMLDRFEPAILTSLITLRTNIYTDPQKPLQVEPKLYEIGDVTPNSNVIVTTNFALTYFAVANELESMPTGTYLIITESGGMSVLTAWAASKFTADIIAKAVKSSGIKEKINHNNIIIPGLVADLKEELEEELPDFNILVGTNEATDIPDFLKNF